MARKLSSSRYVLALVLTIVIFAIGIGVGLLFEDIRLEQAQAAIMDEKVSLASLQLQQKYIDSGLANCDTLNRLVTRKISDLSKKMGVLEDYEKRSFLNEEEFKLQKHDYFLTEIQFLLLSQEIDTKCQVDNVKVIYFYGDDEFDTQGDILLYLKKIFKDDLLIFSLDSNFEEEPMIDILLASYGIHTFPSVVIGNTVYQGHTDVEILQERICSEFAKLGKNLDACEGYIDVRDLMVKESTPLVAN